MKRLAILLCLLLVGSIFVASRASAVCADPAQVPMPTGTTAVTDSGGGACYTKPKEMKINKAGDTKYGHGTPTGTITSETDPLTSASVTCNTEVADEFFGELWPWGWKHAWRLYIRGHWCSNGSTITYHNSSGWTWQADWTFWTHDAVSEEANSCAGTNGTRCYARYRVEFKECLAWFVPPCFYRYPTISITMRADLTSTICWAQENVCEEEKP